MPEIRVIVGHRKCASGQQVQFLSRRNFEPGSDGFQVFRYGNGFYADNFPVKLCAGFEVFDRKGDVIVAGDRNLCGQGLGEKQAGQEENGKFHTEFIL